MGSTRDRGGAKQSRTNGTLSQIVLKIVKCDPERLIQTNIPSLLSNVLFFNCKIL